MPMQLRCLRVNICKKCANRSSNTVFSEGRYPLRDADHAARL